MTAAYVQQGQTLPIATELLLVEYRVKPIVRYVITRHERRGDPRYDRPVSQTVEKGNFDNPVVAFEVAYALAGQEHQMLGWPLGDDRMQYPKGDARYPTTVVGTEESREAAITRMAERFLGWRLPEDFMPDGGVSFTRPPSTGVLPLSARMPSGTNLLHYGQARAMVEYLLEGLVISPAPVQDDFGVQQR